MAGLMAARRLADAGWRVVVVDKGHSPGGRLATRRIGGGRADHGAQFFTVRASEFRGIVEGWLGQGLVYEWSRGWSDGSLMTAPVDGYPRYAVRGGFSALARHVAAGLEIYSSQTLRAVAQEGERWLAISESGEEWRSRSVVLSSPVPQSLALLASGNVQLPADDRAALQSIGYAPCLCGLLVVEGDVTLPAPGALQRPGAPITWVADNRRKGISPEARVITVHAGSEASTQRWALPDEQVLAWMQAEVAQWLSPQSVILETQLKRWRYAVPTTVYPARCLVSWLAAPLVFAGDAFDGPRVEGAALSGWAAADALAAALQARA